MIIFLASLDPLCYLLIVYDTLLTTSCSYQFFIIPTDFYDVFGEYKFHWPDSAHMIRNTLNTALSLNI